MTVSTEVDHNDYTGNGVTTSFPYTFRIFKKSDLVVQVVDLNENITELILDTDYTVTGAGGYTGGNVVLSAPLANGYHISISRELPVTQEIDLRNQGKFFAEVHEDAFDKLTMLIQQVRSWLSLALRKPSFVANYYDALNNYIRNLRDPSRPQDAATKNYVDIVATTNLSHTLRTPEEIPTLPGMEQRKNKIVAMDDSGNPIMVLPESGSASDVMIQLASSNGLKFIGDVPSVIKLNDVIGNIGDKIFLKSYVESENKGGGILVAVDNSTPVDNMVIFNGNGVKWKRLFFNGEVNIYDAGYTGSGDASSFINSINNHGYDCIVSGRCEFTDVINIDVSKGALKGINKCKLIEKGVVSGDYYLQIKNSNTDYEDRDAINATSIIDGISFVISGSRKMSLGESGGGELSELRISNSGFISSAGIEFLDNSYRILFDKCIISRSFNNTIIYNSSINSGEVIKYENCWIVDNGGPLSFKNGQFIFDSCSAPAGKKIGYFDPTFKLSDNATLSFVNGNIEFQPSQSFVAFELIGSSRLSVNNTSITLTNDYTSVPIICNDDGVVFLNSCSLPLFDIVNLSNNAATRQVVGGNSKKVMSYGCYPRSGFITTQWNKGNIVSPYINSLSNGSGQLLNYSNWNLTQKGTGVVTAGTDTDVPNDLMFSRSLYVTIPSVGAAANFYQECEECSPGRYFQLGFWAKSQVTAISGIEFFDKEGNSVQSKTSFSIPDSATWDFYALVDVVPPGASKVRVGFDVSGAIGALHLHNVIYGLI
ncbi:hypothetical protein CSP68_002623 [Salmonella enterica subsp. diarizonae]|nr:hypothetical protein [Salmonella enterica subsp. diarizonae]EDQ7902872.1 hypothetical protein [Salmonella enterica subsp. diarizonae]